MNIQYEYSVKKIIRYVKEIYLNILLLKEKNILYLIQ